MSLSWLVLLSAAISVVFTQGDIFKALREHGPGLWRDLASCPLCSGVWVGGAVYVLSAGFPQPVGWLSVALFVVKTLGMGSLSGCAAVLFVVVWDTLLAAKGLLEKRIG